MQQNRDDARRTLQLTQSPPPSPEQLPPPARDSPPAKTPRRRRLRPRAVVTGLYGEDALAHIFRWGGTTSAHLARRLGIPKHTADNALRNLYKSKPQLAGLTRVPPDGPHNNGGRWQNYWYLSAAGVTYGGSMAGQEIPAAARGSYRRCDQPDKARHAHARNTFFVLAHEDGERVGASVPLDHMDGESHRSFPLAGARTTGSARYAGASGDDDPPTYEWIVPDGTFLVAYRDLPAGRFLLEVERGQKYQPRVVRDKIDRYAALFLRLLKEREKGLRRPRSDGRPFYTAKLLPGGVCPVLFVYDEARKAGLMRDNILAAASGREDDDDEELVRYRTLVAYGNDRGFDAGRLFLFAGFDELKERGALAGVYRALSAYDVPMVWDRVPLRAAAAASFGMADAVAPERGQGVKEG